MVRCGIRFYVQSDAMRGGNERGEDAGDAWDAGDARDAGDAGDAGDG